VMTGGHGAISGQCRIGTMYLRNETIQFQRALRLGQVESRITHAIECIWVVSEDKSSARALFSSTKISEVSREPPPTYPYVHLRAALSAIERSLFRST
jgi:hypothetical protein